ncbi:DUF5680 domain-containing protein [Rhizobium sp.]|uniref:DUF5680 domain-containing protein n=1 Tax=Rhizobium sp. TaxID=391 RepID=UPI000E94143D|nr:hypothetical protein [Rhizobium sp.]
MDALETFIVAAKASCYVGGSQKQRISCRTASHDLIFRQGPFSYMDSYFGGTDFIGQEVVWQDETPIWAMNYYGRITCDDHIDSTKAGQVIKSALSALYQQGRFLGGHDFQYEGFLYRDQSTGTYRGFKGFETISIEGFEVYRLDYHGGMIRA